MAQTQGFAADAERSDSEGDAAGMTGTDDDQIIAAYDRSVSEGAVRFGVAQRGVQATLAAAVALGLGHSGPVVDALRRVRHADVLAWDESKRRVASPPALPALTTRPKAKLGRPRKDGPRTESGRLSRARVSTDAQIMVGAMRLDRADASGPHPAELARMRDWITSQVRETPSAWLTPAGRDFISRRLHQTLYAEAVRIHDARHAMLDAIQARRCRTAALDPSGGEPIDPDSDAGLAEAGRHLNAVAAWDETKEAIWRIALAEERERPGASAYTIRQAWLGAVLRYCVEGGASQDDSRRAIAALGVMVRERVEAKRIEGRRRRRQQVA